MKMFTKLIIALVLASSVGAQSDDHPLHNYVPPGGYVAAETTAVQIAEAVLVPIYGKETIEKEKPLIATLSGDVWTVSGTLHNGFFVKKNGGVALIEISKIDGKILRVTHGK